MPNELDQIREMLIDIGLDAAAASDGTRLRADLGLNSSETVQLEIELDHRFSVYIDLWDARDYTILDLANIVRK